MAKLTADELRALTPRPGRVTDLSRQLGAESGVEVALARLAELLLQTGIAMAGHLDRIATVLEDAEVEDREYRARVTSQVEKVANGAKERAAAVSGEGAGA
jgi:hypothetical protein